MRIAITGGKGGTGKSTVATALAYALSEHHKVLLADADVDCPNDHLLLGIGRTHLRTVDQRIPAFDLRKCTGCSACASACRSNAVAASDKPIFMVNQCNGCGACRTVCPSDAISWSTKRIGDIFTGSIGNLDLISGELVPNQPVSEFVVNHLNEEIEKKRDSYSYVIIDTQAGTHCPVIAALEDADEVIAVTEPTPLGAHDLGIILQLLQILRKPSSIIINRSDIGDRSIICNLSDKYGSKIIAEIPYSDEIVRSYVKGKPIIIPGLASLFTGDHE